MYNGKKIGLAFGGGAARGFAHIGVLKVLEKHNIIPDYIAGTSFGSIVGSLYANGMNSDDLIKFANKMKKRDLMDLNLFKVTREGLLSGKKLVRYIDAVAKSAKIENLKIPFKCNAVDLNTGKEYIFESGLISEAVRASCCVPGYFAPVRKDDMILMDGGIINNVPFDIVKKMGADYVIAVDVLPDCFPKKKFSSVFDYLLVAFNIIQFENEKKKVKLFKELLDEKIDVFFDVHPADFSVNAVDIAIKAGEEYAEKHIAKILADLSDTENKTDKKAITGKKQRKNSFSRKIKSSNKKQ